MASSVDLPGGAPPAERYPPSRLAVVAIGRNEGERLVRCLDSVRAVAEQVVYVDSGSTDGSVAHARSVGAQVVELDMSLPFTAARARNAGLEAARARTPELQWVQFLDGDCEMDPGWLPAAFARVEEDPSLAVVCGRRRERHPDRTVFNRLCDLEWDTPVGEALASGGDALMRVEALLEVDGFRPELIAGEEPELCYRLRRAGWRIERIDAEMTLHDADITRLEQWWKRSERAGHAFAEWAVLHGVADDERMGVKEAVSSVAWASMATAGAVVPPLGVAVSAAAAASAFRNYRRLREGGLERADAALYAGHCVAAKLPQAVGVTRLLMNRLRRKDSRLIEYKA